MRALREQPRVTVAKILVVAALIAIGAVVGATLDGDQVTQARLASAQQSLTATAVELRVARGRIERGATALDLAKQDVRVLARENRRLRHELHAAQQARRQARRQR